MKPYNRMEQTNIMMENHVADAKFILDYSQYRMFQFCPWKWYEHYINQLDPIARVGQKDDALTLGSLVHAALQSYRTIGTPTITDEVVASLDPTPECLAWAQQLALGYVQTYPNEQFTRYFCEEPLRAPLTGDTDLLAKVDSYFDIDEPTTIASGLGDELVLTPGRWIHEYKTKDVSRSSPNFILSYKVNAQPAFQMLAASHSLGRPIEGVLINVIEKPRPYVPKHTCKQCKQSYDRSEWVAVGGKEFACPVCDTVRALDTSDKSRVERKINYYRLMVQHSANQLDYYEESFVQCAEEMERIRKEKNPWFKRADERCVDSTYGPCSYFGPHSEWRGAETSNDFVKIDALGYLGLKNA